MRSEAWFWWRCGVRYGGTRGRCGVVISWGAVEVEEERVR